MGVQGISKIKFKKKLRQKIHSLRIYSLGIDSLGIHSLGIHTARGLNFGLRMIRGYATFSSSPGVVVPCPKLSSLKILPART